MPSVQARPPAYAQKRPFLLSTTTSYYFQQNSFRPPPYTQCFSITIDSFTFCSRRQAFNSDATPDSTSTAHLRTRINFKLSPLMIPNPPPWLRTPPQVVLDLTQYPKCCTNLAAYCAHFLQIASRFPKATLVTRTDPNPTTVRVLRTRSTKWLTHTDIEILRLILLPNYT